MSETWRDKFVKWSVLIELELKVWSSVTADFHPKFELKQ